MIPVRVSSSCAKAAPAKAATDAEAKRMDFMSFLVLSIHRNASATSIGGYLRPWTATFNAEGAARGPRARV
jgi:hypothetical protein